MSFYYISFTFLNECVIQDWASNALPTLMVFTEKLPWSCVQLTVGYLLLSAPLSSCRPIGVNQSQTGYVFWILQSSVDCETCWTYLSTVSAFMIRPVPPLEHRCKENCKGLQTWLHWNLCLNEIYIHRNVFICLLSSAQTLLQALAHGTAEVIQPTHTQGPQSF